MGAKALTLNNLDVGRLIWDIRRNLDGAVLTQGGTAVVQFHCSDGHGDADIE